MFDLIIWIGTCAIIAHFMGGLGYTIFVMAASIILVPVWHLLKDKLKKE